MTHILEHIPCSDNGDIKRFLKKFEGWIRAGELERTDEFEESKAKVSLLEIAEGEMKEAEESKTKLKKKRIPKNHLKKKNQKMSWKPRLSILSELMVGMSRSLKTNF